MKGKMILTVLAAFLTGMAATGHVAAFDGEELGHSCLDPKTQRLWTKSP